jgi:multiple sugar transport system permease protein
MATTTSAATPALARPRRRRLGIRGREIIAGYLFISPWIVGLLIFQIAAIGYSFYLSFFNSNLLAPPIFVGRLNYTLVIHDLLFRKAVVNTIYYTGVSVPLSIALAFAIALLLNQKIAFLGVWRTIYYLPSVVSGVATAVLWAWLFQPDIGLIDGALRAIGVPGPQWLASERWAMPALIIMSLWGVGGSMIIFLAGLQGVPAHLYDAAKIDGANTWRCFWHVTVPMMTPTLFFTFIMGIIGSFQVFTQAYALTQGGPNNATLTYVLLIYQDAYQQFRMGYASALAWVLFAIILVFTLLAIATTSRRVYYEGGER